MEDFLCFDDKDLAKRVQELADEYFYDFPLIVHDVYFGKKSNSIMGQAIPLDGIPSQNIAEMNLKEVEGNPKSVACDIEINGHFKGLNVDETLLHEMVHCVNFTEGDWDAKHGKKFKEVAEVIGKRSGHDFSSTSGDDYLNTLLSSINLLKKIKKEPSNMVFSRKVLKSYMKFEDIYAKTIDELNSIYEGCGDLMADLVENGDVDSEKDLNECADEMDKILPKPQLRWWNFK